MCDRGSFLIEEFRANWDYIRHIENLRTKHMEIYLIISGALITLIEKNINGLLPLAGIFIFTYGFLFCVFLVWQKRGYDIYARTNANIRREMEHLHDLEQIEMLKRFSVGDKFGGPFFIWYLMSASISVLGLIIFFRNIDLGITWSVSYYFIAILLSFAVYILIYYLSLNKKRDTIAFLCRPGVIALSRR